ARRDPTGALPPPCGEVKDGDHWSTALGGGRPATPQRTERSSRTPPVPASVAAHTLMRMLMRDRVGRLDEDVEGHVAGLLQGQRQLELLADGEGAGEAGEAEAEAGGVEGEGAGREVEVLHRDHLDRAVADRQPDQLDRRGDVGAQPD